MVESIIQIKWNNDKCWCECNKHHIFEKDYTCDEIKETKTITTNFNEKKVACKTQNWYALLAFF